jgi:ribosomal protein S12 methylthiotransferase
MRFDRLGAFAYSHETGTYASLNYEDEVPEVVKKQRLDTLMRVQKTIVKAENAKKVGKIFQTIIDRKEGGFYIGRTAFDSPEVDPEVLIMSDKRLRIGAFYDVRIEKIDAYDLVGKVVFFSNKNIFLQKVDKIFG